MQINRTEIDSNWFFRQQDSKEWLSVDIPGCVHTDLFNNKKIEYPFYRTNEKNQQWIDKVNWEYRTTFTVTLEALKKNNHRLVFEGLDTYADVYLNGEKVIEADNMFRIWPVEVNGYLRGSNELLIVFAMGMFGDSL